MTRPAVFSGHTSAWHVVHYYCHRSAHHHPLNAPDLRSIKLNTVSWCVPRIWRRMMRGRVTVWLGVGLGDARARDRHAPRLFGVHSASDSSSATTTTATTTTTKKSRRTRGFLKHEARALSLHPDILSAPQGRQKDSARPRRSPALGPSSPQAHRPWRSPRGGGSEGTSTAGRDTRAAPRQRLDAALSTRQLHRLRLPVLLGGVHLGIRGREGRG